MLYSLAAVSVIGGGLAFKARYHQLWCANYPVQSSNGELTCPPTVECLLLAHNATITDAGGIFVCVASTVAIDNNGNPTCMTNGVGLSCFQTMELIGDGGNPLSITPTLH